LQQLVKASIAVVGDRIWIGGFDDLGGVIARLDPATLAPIVSSPVARDIGGVIVAPGSNGVWITTSGPGVWCIDANNGAILARWRDATTPVASSAGHAYVIVQGTVRNLLLPNPCAG
jgi:hypothetical protein